MPIYRLLQGEAFDPETAEMLGQCFEAILIDLNLAKRTDPVTLLVAQQVIEFAKWGERQPDRLRQRVLEAFKRDQQT
jgi:hypothetical protein